MARKFLTAVDLVGNEIQNAKVQNVASLPTLTSGDAGRQVYLTTTGRYYTWNGTAWGLQATDVDTFNGQAASFYTSLANQSSGSLTASRISDLATAVHAYTLDSFAAPAGPLSAGSQRITNVATPSTSTDAAPKGYVDTTVSALASGLVLKGSVRVATAANVSLASPGSTVDGITMAAGNVVMLMGQTTTSQNGPWVWNGAAVAMTRPVDGSYTAGGTATPGAFWDVREGTSADLFVLLITATAVTVDTTATSFVVRGSSTAGATSGYGTTVSGSQVNVNPGTGILVPSSANSTVSVDTTVVGRKVTGTVPVTTTGIYSVSGSVVTVNHALGNLAPLLQVRFGSSPPTLNGTVQTAGTEAEVDNTASDLNNLVITFPGTLGANNYVISIIG